MRISNLTLGIVDTNTYFIENEENVILIDPSSESQKIIKKLNQINKPLKAILLTHAHYDHIGALDNIIEKYQVPVYMSKDEFDFLNARKIFDCNVESKSENRACICGEILRGLKNPPDCKVFGKVCNPQNPLGSCMVSSEGACAAYYKYKRD